MSKRLMILFSLIIMVGALTITAQNGNGPGKGECRFIDENGDGINDNYRDHDGDGIPNFKDPDWIRPKDGTGYGSGNGKGKMNGKRDGTGNRRNSAMLDHQAGFSHSFQAFNNFCGNFGAGMSNNSGTTSLRGRGRRGGR